MKRLVSLAWPVSVGETAGALGPTVDMIWIGRLGADALAGAGMAGVVIALIMNTLVGILMGLRAAVARHMGAGDVKSAQNVAMHAFIVSAAFSVTLGVVIVASGDRLMSLLGLSAGAASQGASFLRVMAAGLPVFSLRLTAESVMQASGDTITPMKLSIAHRILHLGLAPALVFGFGLPALGAPGAALSSIITQGVALTAAMWVLATGHTRLHLRVRGLIFEPRTVWKMVRVGAPASAGLLQNDLAQMIIMRIMAGYGPVAVAATVIARRLEMVLSIPGLGLGTAGGTIAGHGLGANDPALAKRTGWMAAILATAFSLFGAVVVLLAAGLVARVFASESGLVAMTTVFLRINSIAYLVFGAIIVFFLFLNVLGDTVPVMLILSGSIWLLGVLPASVLPQRLGLSVYGLRWLLMTPTVVTALALTLYYASGKWLRRRV